MNYSRIGKQLKLLRERKGLNYEQVFEVTKIQPSILRGIEEGNSSISPAFLKGFIKTYALFLDLDIKVLFREEEEKKEQRKDVKKDQKTEDQSVKKSKRNYFKYILFFLALLILCQWFWFRGEPEKESVDEISIASDSNPDSFKINKKKGIQKKEILENKSLFHQIKESVFKKELLIQSPEPLNVYFKVDKSLLVNQTLKPFTWFSIKAKNKIYIRFDELRVQIEVFYNGKQIDIGNKSFFEKTF